MSEGRTRPGARTVLLGAYPTSTGALGRSLASVLTVFTALYVLHVGIEAGVGGWEPTHLETIGFSAGAAATATSVYWLMTTVGRFLVAPTVLRSSAQAIITVSCVGMAVSLVLAVVPALAPYAYAGVGLFIAPIFRAVPLLLCGVSAAGLAATLWLIHATRIH
ncbi:hypothetical protein [Streptomyces rochei]|uniref:hypothetical protein n=1 Tax=Streptomyces rochei TaxID=1928 RepID=UPI00362CF270